MSDRCYSRLICRVKDAFRFSALGYCLDESLDDGCIGMVDEQADFGHSEELEKLAGESLVFHGCSGHGDEYPAVVFASDGEEYATCDTIIPGGLPAMELAEDGAILGREEAERYWRVWRSVCEKLSGAGESPAANIIG